MEPLDALARARGEFSRRLDGVGPGDWDRPTPCEGWSVRDLVGHVVTGDHITSRLLAGEGWADALAAAQAEALGDDPRRAFAAAAAAAAAAFAEPGVAERVCHHVAGDIPGAQVMGFRIGDYTLHAWDLARATGGDETLDSELVERVWRSLSPMAPFIGETGFFGSGPSGDVGEDAPLQARLLDLVGRRP